MTVSEVVAIIAVLLTALGFVATIAWRSSSALTAVRLELAAFRVQLADLMTRPPTWCVEQQRRCEVCYERREVSGVHAPPLPRREPGGA